MSDLIVFGANVTELGWRPSMSRLACAEPIARLCAGFNRPMHDKPTLALWWERLSTSQITAEEWKATTDWFLEFGKNLPTLPAAIQQAKTIREEALRKRREAEHMQAIAAPRIQGPGMSWADEQYERKRQAMKRQLGIGDYRQAEHVRRYGPEVGADALKPEPGPVLLPDGSPDPEWPELPDRQPAWRRKALYDAGLWSLAQAQAPTRLAARKAAPNLTERGNGPRKMF